MNFLKNLQKFYFFVNFFLFNVTISLMLNRNYFFCGLVGTVLFFFSSFIWAATEKNTPDLVKKSQTKESISQKNSSGVESGAGEGIVNQKQGDFVSDPYKRNRLITERSSNASFVFMILRMLLVVFSIVALALLFLYFLKKKQKIENEEQSLIRSIVNYRLSASLSIQIIRVAQDYFMFVGGNEGSPYVEKIEDKQSIDEIKIFENQKTVAVPRFFDDFFKMGTSVKSKGVGSNFLGLPRALTVTKMMREKMRKK